MLFPNRLVVGSEAHATVQFRVPIDDTHTFHVSIYTWRAAPGGTAPTQDAVPYRYVPLTGDDGSGQAMGLRELAVANRKEGGSPVLSMIC